MTDNKNTVRLNRYLAMCGLGARRKVEEFVTDGRVKINGEVVTEPGRQVSASDQVEFDGKNVAPTKLTYLIYHKPRGLLCAVEDSRVQTVIDALPTSYDALRLFPVGRLDRESEGLLILTNDGMFAQELIHPSKGTTKTYEVELRRPLPEEKLVEWTQGVEGDVEGEDRFLRPLSVRRLGRSPLQCWFEVVLGEGVKREIRVMARALGNDVRQLKRTRIGKLELKNLPAGEFVEVSKDELWHYVRDGHTV